MKQNGFSLTEALLAISLLGIVLAGILPTFLTFLDANTLSEERSQAVAVAQQVMEDLRESEPKSLPTTGSGAVEFLSVGQREFEIERHYCLEPSFCSSNSRQVVVEVRYGGETIYSVETVLTALR